MRRLWCRRAENRTWTVEGSTLVLRDRANEPVLRVPWESIVRIRATKRDLLTFDQTNIIVDLTAGCTIDFSEDDPGFADVLGALRTWIGIPDPRTSLAPFACTPIQLYERDRQMD